MWVWVWAYAVYPIEFIIKFDLKCWNNGCGGVLCSYWILWWPNKLINPPNESDWLSVFGIFKSNKGSKIMEDIWCVWWVLTKWYIRAVIYLYIF